MKQYFGGRDGKVMILDGGKASLLGTFSWGSTQPKSADLAREILKDLLAPDVSRAIRLHRRFLHRTVATWKKGEPWRFSDAEFKAVVADMEQVEKDMAQTVRQIDRELAPRFVDAPMSGQEWSSDPKLTPNIQRRST